MDFSNIEPFGTESSSTEIDHHPPELDPPPSPSPRVDPATNSQRETPVETEMVELNTPMVEPNTPMAEINTPLVEINMPRDEINESNVEPESEPEMPNIEPVALRAHSVKIELEAPFHASSVLTELQALQREQILCDVRLTTDTGGVSAHKVVLMATSPSMRLRLATGDTKNELIHFDNIPLSLLETVVKYMYTGKLNFESSCKDQLMKFCEDLELSCAVNLLKYYTKSDNASDTSEGTENESYLYKTKPDSRNKSRSSIGKHTEKKETVKNKKTNRRVKQTPKKRTAKNPVVELEDLADTAPDKLLKLSSDVLIQKVLEQGIIKEEPQTHPVVYSGRGRPKKNSLRPPKKIKKATKRKAVSKPKYVSKKVKNEKAEENVEYDENGEKIYDFTQISPERAKTSRREVNALKSVISANTVAETNPASPLYSEMSSVKELKTEKLSDDEHDPDFDGDTETEQGDADYVEHKKPKKKNTPWSRRKKQPCSMCDKILSTKKRLVFHLYCQHGIDYDRSKYRMYYCPVEGCGHISSSRNNLRTHTRSRHSEDRPHICEFCGKSFKLNSGLATHLNVHTGAKVYECKKCGERFNQHSGLDVHIKRYHMGESSFSELCHLCSEKFLQKSDLCWHLFRVHDQPLPDNYKA